MINRSVEHADSEVTTLQWSENNLQVFAGDKSGKISVLNLTSAMVCTYYDCCELSKVLERVWTFYSQVILTEIFLIY